MGTWGTAIFSDDLACDVRDAYRDLIAKGSSAAQAKSQMISRHSDLIADEEDGPVFWLSLAASARALGRLDEELKQKALAIIASKSDLSRWEDSKLQRARSAALDKLAHRLQTPQKSEVAVKKTRVIGTDWQLGEVVGLKLTEGDDFVLLHVVDFEANEETRYPVIQVLSWRGNTVPPTNAEIQSAAVAGEIFDKTQACELVLTMRWSRRNEARVARWGLSKKLSRRRPGWLSSLLRLNANQPARAYAGFGAIDACCDDPSGWPLGYALKSASQ